MSVAERTREAVQARPFLRDALAAGVVNYAALAASLDVDAGEEAVAAALRRYESELTAPGGSGAARVRLERGIEPCESATDAVLTVGGESFRSGEGRLAAVIARGAGATPTACERVLGRLRTADVGVTAAAVGGDAVTVIVSGRESATALRVTERVFE